MSVLTSFNYVLRTYTKNESTSDTEDEKTMSCTPPNKNLFQYTEKLAANALRREDVQEEHDLNESVMEELHKSMRQCMRGYRASRKPVSLHDLAYRAKNCFSCKAANKDHYTSKAL